ncbi:SH3 domain-containing protein [Streptomyces salinarius]|uniref:SH3 domain-containing protein n=1 Tax=Streptomyces salinarius TaxID=2762598 RepID=UPI00164798FF|nr:SH3 domain-containing protein [Streptomyces salinarius]
MITAAAAAAFTAAALFAGPVPATAAGCGYEATTTVHLRSGPGSGYVSLGLLREGDRLGTPKQKRGGWWKTFTMDRTASGIKAGRTGWVKASYLRKSVCMRLE